MKQNENPRIGQDAICPEGEGRVVAFDREGVTVETYLNGRTSTWNRIEVTLLPPGLARDTL